MAQASESFNYRSFGYLFCGVFLTSCATFLIFGFTLQAANGGIPVLDENTQEQTGTMSVFSMIVVFIILASFFIVGVWSLLIFRNEEISIAQNTIVWRDSLGRQRVEASGDEILDYHMVRNRLDRRTFTYIITTKNGVVRFTSGMRNHQKLAQIIQELAGTPGKPWKSGR